jgi:NADH-quinone oxidoreductase subunit N
MMDGAVISLAIMGIMAVVMTLLNAVCKELKKWMFGLITGGLIASLLFSISSFGQSAYLFMLPSYIDTSLALHVTPLAVFFEILVLLASLMLVLASWDYTRKTRYYGVFLLSITGALLLPFARDLLTIYFAWEIMTVPSYALVLFRPSRKSVEGSVKYLIFGILSSALMLFGMILLAVTTGHTDLAGIGQYISTGSNRTQLTFFTGILLTVAMGIKVGIVPFHMWIPDSYQGAPRLVAGYLSAVTKKAGLIAILMVVMATSLVSSGQYNPIFVLLALVTMFWGNVAALKQRNMVRMLAYSSIAQMGYIFIGFSVNIQFGMEAALYHALTHAVMDALAFIAVFAIFHATGAITIESYKGISRKLPKTALFLSLALFSLAGMPPLAGFTSKLFLFKAGIDGGLWWLSLVALGFSVFSLAYYLKPIIMMYSRDTVEANDDTGDADEREKPLHIPSRTAVSMGIGVILLFLLGLYPDIFMELIARAIALL